MSQKNSILEAIQQLPEEAGFDEAIEQIRILQGIERGVKAADEGQVRSHEEVRALIRSWAGQ